MARPQLKISVPKPCSESWAAMTPQAQGRFCASCATTVMDFTQFSDTQLLAYFANVSGKTCGRFSVSQLNRPVYAALPAKQTFFPKLAATVTLFFGITSQTQAQNSPRHLAPARKVMEKKVSEDANSAETVGKTPEKVNPEKLVITGRIVDAVTQEPISFCSVILKESRTFKSAGPIYTQADIAGNFSLTVPDAYLPEKFSIQVFFVGYRDGEFELTRKDLAQKRDFEMVSAPQVAKANVAQPAMNKSDSARIKAVPDMHFHSLTAVVGGEVTVQSVITENRRLPGKLKIDEVQTSYSFRNDLQLLWWRFKNLFRKQD